MKQNNRHIAIITGQHMTANPRVWKEANSLAEAGYQVSVLTTIYDSARAEHDKKLLHSNVIYKASVNLIKKEGTFFEVFISRLGRKLAMIKKRLLKKDSRPLLAYLPSKQVNKALAEDADLYIAHQEAGLIIGCELLKKGKKVAFDFEDWYSKDYINKLRPVSMLEKAEAFALKASEFVLCPSKSMADALCKRYQPKKNPVVIYNSFSIKEASYSTTKTYHHNSVVWMSQIVGPDRGLENLIAALDFLEEALEINIIGQVQNHYKEELISKVSPTKHKIFFHGVMQHNELLPFMSRFSIGLAIENSFPENKNVTISNKMFQYIQTGIKVLATNTAGQAEVARHFENSICLVDADNPEQWAKGLKKLLQYSRSSESQQRIFCEQFAWETQEKKLLELVSHVLSR